MCSTHSRGVILQILFPATILLVVLSANDDGIVLKLLPRQDPRSNVTLHQLNIVGNNSVTVEVSKEVGDFQCFNITVDPAESINVQQGDFLGMYATVFAVLPVVSSNTGSGRVFFFQVTTPPCSVFLLGSGQPLATQLVNHAVHITSTIGKFDNKIIILGCYSYIIELQ